LKAAGRATSYRSTDGDEEGENVDIVTVERSTERVNTANTVVGTEHDKVVTDNDSDELSKIESSMR